MFTGIVREVGRLTAVATARGVTRLELDAPASARVLAAGDSLAINGVCVTVTRAEGTRVAVDATPETRRVTTVARWRAGDSVHVEPALRVGDAVGGHFVLGHVDGTGRIVALSRRGDAAWMTIAIAPALAGQLVPKGSIAVDGVSLTLDAGPFPGRFTVTLIPATLAHTRFGVARAGDHVNIELDILAKAATRPVTVSSILARGWVRPGGLDRERT
ncbi:MAG: riboflavin synthase [Acidobacteria bacterium]|nr:riboflavin synthase [Acidobacteriota bacterium]